MGTWNNGFKTIQTTLYIRRCIWWKCCKIRSFSWRKCEQQKTSVPVERKKIVWSSNESIPKTEPEIEKKEFPILEPEYKDEWGARPFYFPMGEKTSQSKAEETRKLLPQYVQNRLAEIDSDDTSEEDVASAIGLKSTSSASPTSVAAKQCVLVDSDGVLFQLPSVFPSPLQDSKNSVSDVPCAATELPEGKIGKLQIYKSGKVRLKMGEVILDVNEGTSWGFHQQLVAINVREDDGHCVFLGDVKKRAICTLNTSQLL